MKSKESS